MLLRKQFVGVLLLLGACINEPSAPQAVVCPSIALPAIAVRLVDSRSGALAPFFNVRVYAWNNTRSDSTTRNAILPHDLLTKNAALLLLRQHPGTYNVLIAVDGYETLLVTNFKTVSNLRCKAGTDTLVARLKRP